MECSLLDSSVHGISQARILERVAISFSRRSSWPRGQACVSCIGRQILYHWARHVGSSHLAFVVQLRSPGWLFVTPWTVAHLAPLSSTVARNLFTFRCIGSVILSNLCCPLLLLPSVFLSISVFSNELALCIRWRKYWSFSFSKTPSSEYSGLISFRIDWFDLLYCL